MSFFLGVFTTSAVKLMIENFLSIDFSLMCFGCVLSVTFFVYLFLLSRNDGDVIKLTIMKVILSATFLILPFFFLKSLFEKAYAVSGSNGISFFLF